jgi:hypothetical protein
MDNGRGMHTASRLMEFTTPPGKEPQKAPSAGEVEAPATPHATVDDAQNRPQPALESLAVCYSYRKTVFSSFFACITDNSNGREGGP